jgi:hypothetical protein
MDSFNQAQHTTKETFQLQSGRLVEEVKRIIHEGNVRRIVVKQDERTIVKFPLAVGVVGTLLAAPLAALGALAALLNDCTIEVEREEIVSEAPSTSAQPTSEQPGGQADTVSAIAEQVGAAQTGDTARLEQVVGEAASANSTTAA